MHLHSASSLLDADYRMPSLDYEDLIQVSSLICRSLAAGQMMFRRMVFNLFPLNQYDHIKNWTFLQQDNGQWQLTPFFDVTFSPSSYNEHATAFCGSGQNPSLRVMKKLADQANFSSWTQAKEVIEVIEDVLETVYSFSTLNVKPETIRLISKQLDDVYAKNHSSAASH